MAPQIPSKPTKEEQIIVQELGSSATSDGSRKRRKSIVSSSPTKNLNGDISGVEVNGTMNGSPRGRNKVNGNANGIGSRGMLVVGK